MVTMMQSVISPSAKKPLNSQPVSTRRRRTSQTFKGGPSFKLVSLSDLVLDERNANVGTARGRRMLEQSLRDLGAGRSILVDRQGRIIAGNKTVKEARKLGMKNIAIVQSRGDTLVAVQRSDLDLRKDKKAMRLAIADNRINEVDLSWSADALKGYGLDLLEFWNDRELKNFGLAVTPLEAPEPKLEHAAELRRKWETTPGQLWKIGKHRLLCGDCTAIPDVRRLMNSSRACLFATDPPYLVDYNGTNHPHKWTSSHGRNHPGDKDWRRKYADVDSPEQGEALYESFVKVAVENAIAENAAWYCWHASRRQRLLEAVWEKYGAFVHQQIVWAKDRPILTRSWYMWQHEPCFFGWVRGHKPKRVADDYPSSIWSFPTIAPGETTDHPTQKPVELFAIPIRQHTGKGDLCYEPFSGSGTQLVAAQLLGRVCYAIEKSPEFVAVALERLSEMGLKPKVVK
jgi:DNA modification methylase